MDEQLFILLTIRMGGGVVAKRTPITGIGFWFHESLQNRIITLGDTFAQQSSYLCYGRRILVDSRSMRLKLEVNVFAGS